MRSTVQLLQQDGQDKRGGEAVGSGIIVIRHETSHDCRNIVGNHRGKFHLCGGEIGQLGPVSHDEVVEAIERMTSTRDMSLPQRCDAPKYPRFQGSSHGCKSPGYKNMGDNVGCGLLELLAS